MDKRCITNSLSLLSLLSLLRLLGLLGLLGRSDMNPVREYTDADLPS